VERRFIERRRPGFARLSSIMSSFTFAVAIHTLVCALRIASITRS
jgi:hypothetical protein